MSVQRRWATVTGPEPFAGPLAGGVGAIVAAVVFVAPVVHAALRTASFDRPASFPLAVAIAVTGVFVGGSVDLLVGWLPLVGPFLSPFAWAYVVKNAGRSDWPSALFLGALAWLSTLVFQAALGLV